MDFDLLVTNKGTRGGGGVLVRPQRDPASRSGVIEDGAT